MLPKMSEEKTTAPVMIISSQNEALTAAVPPKYRSYRKYVIVAVSGIALALIILAAILVGMYFFTTAQKDILKFAYNRDANTKEEVTSDPNTNILQFHVNSPEYELWVIDDFNRDIQVMKIKRDSGTNCYVTPLNRTLAPDPSKISAPSNPEAMKPNASYTVTYEASNTTIPDTSFLSKAARDKCNGISTYWIYPRCEALKVPPPSSDRQKRYTYYERWCSESCWWFFCSTVCKWVLIYRY